MKRMLLLFSLADVASARVIDVPFQAVSPSFADTEVSTNLVIHPSRTDVREVKIHLQLIGTEYNDLEIGFGRDVNTNGVLDVEEIETVYRKNGLFHEPSRTGYRRRDTREYDDCIMKEAEARVKPPPYSLIGLGKPKYNCQDYADAL